MKMFEMPEMNYWGEIDYNPFVRLYKGSAETRTPHWTVVASEPRDDSLPKAFFYHKYFKGDDLNPVFEADTWQEAWLKAMSFGMRRFPL